MYYCTQLHLMHIPASSLQVWCDGCGIPPPRTWVRCSLTMHTGLAEREFTYLQLTSTLLACCCPLWVSPPSEPMSWGYLPSTSPALRRNSKAADAAHIILPGLPLLNALFGDAKGGIHIHGLVTGENSPAITDNAFGRACGGQGSKKHLKVVPLILRARSCSPGSRASNFRELRSYRGVLGSLTDAPQYSARPRSPLVTI